MKAIQISGGIDSLAMLFLLRDLWNEGVVMWVNSGAAYPETMEYMYRIRNLVPRFVEVPGRQPAVLTHHGFPVDVVPMSKSFWGEVLTNEPLPVKYQFAPDCCRRSLWEPTARMCELLGVTDVYRGQKHVDRLKSPIRDGHRDPSTGIVYHFPLHNWSREQVWEFVEEMCPSWIPPYYREGEESSHDCWNCTGYVADNRVRISHLPDQQRAEVESRLATWRQNVLEELNAYHQPEPSSAVHVRPPVRSDEQHVRPGDGGGAPQAANGNGERTPGDGDARHAGQ